MSMTSLKNTFIDSLKDSSFFIVPIRFSTLMMVETVSDFDLRFFFHQEVAQFDFSKVSIYNNFQIFPHFGHRT